MKKLICSLFSALLSLSVILPGAATVMAAPGQEGQAQLTARKVLVIKAPPLAEVNQAVTMTVSSKHESKPVSGATVYAIKTGLLTIKSDKADFAGIASDYLAVAKGKGTLLGNTDSNGIINFKFADSSRYLLIASLDGYVPGFSRISIITTPKKSLNIKAPGNTEVGKPVTLAVTETFGGNVIADASIYARKIRDIISLPITSTTAALAKTMPGNIDATAIAPTLKANIADFEGSQKKAAEIKEKGFLLGSTDDKGELIYTFKEAAVYEMAVIKDNCNPGFARMSVTLADQKRLNIRVPSTADNNTAVAMTVMDRKGGGPVADAAVYALKIIDRVLSVNRLFETIHKDEKVSVYMGEKYTSIIKEKGFPIGNTNAAGQLNYTFKEQGWYVILAVKDGFLPGFFRIDINRAGQKRLDIKAPGSSPTGQPATITVTSRPAQETVDLAAVYAVKISIAPSPGPSDNRTKAQGIIKVEPSNTAEAEKYAALARQSGILLGNTGKSGTVVYTFNDAGLYALVAIKDGFTAGFARINIHPAPGKSLLIEMASEAFIGQAVPIIVREKLTPEGVTSAGLYAARMEGITGTIGDLLRADPSETDTAAREKFAAAVKEKGIFLGWTDENGLYLHKFAEAGHYIVVAIKDGYAPGFDRVNVKPVKPEPIQTK